MGLPDTNISSNINTSSGNKRPVEVVDLLITPVKAARNNADHFNHFNQATHHCTSYFQQIFHGPQEATTENMGMPQNVPQISYNATFHPEMITFGSPQMTSMMSTASHGDTNLLAFPSPNIPQIPYNATRLTEEVAFGSPQWTSPYPMMSTSSNTGHTHLLASHFQVNHRMYATNKSKEINSEDFHEAAAVLNDKIEVPSIDIVSTYMVGCLKLIDKNPSVTALFRRLAEIMSSHDEFRSHVVNTALTHEPFVTFASDLETCPRALFEQRYFGNSVVELPSTLYPWNREYYYSPGMRTYPWGEKGYANATKIVQTFRTLLIILRYKQLYPENMVSADSFRVILDQMVSALTIQHPWKNYKFEADMHFDSLHRFYNSFIAAERMNVPPRNENLILSCAKFLQFDGIRVTFGGAMSVRSEIIKGLQKLCL